jgi:hypothetical protein
VDPADALGGVLAHLVGVDRLVVDLGRLSRRRRHFDLEAGVVETLEWVDALLAPVAVLADDE